MGELCVKCHKGERVDGLVCCARCRDRRAAYNRTRRRCASCNSDWALAGNHLCGYCRTYGPRGRHRCSNAGAFSNEFPGHEERMARLMSRAARRLPLFED